MVDTIPAWLISSFVRAVANLGGSASPEETKATARQLAQRWSDPQRHYHNTEYLKEILENVDLLADQARNADAVRLAAWYHGAIFDVSPDAVNRGQGGLNIMASADFTADELSRLGVSETNAALVVGLIRSLYRHNPPDDIDAQVLSDADLAVLASDPEQYHDYQVAIRKEYGAFSDSQFVSARRAVLESLLARHQLYFTHGAQVWEEPARENIRAELERLNKTNTAGLSLPAGDSADVARQSSDASTPTPQAQVEASDEAADSQLDGDINPYSPTEAADLGSTLETAGEVMDTLVMKAIKADEVPLKPMSD